MTDVGSEEIDGSALKTYEIVVTGVSFQDERRKKTEEVET